MLQPVNIDPVPSDPLAGLPLWQRRYLLAYAATGSPKRSMAAAGHVSAESVQTALDRDPRFARAHAMAVAGVALGGRELARDIASAASSSLVVDAVEASRDPQERGSDRLGNRRLVLEAAGVVGGTAVNVAVVDTTGPLLAAIRELAARPSGAVVEGELSPSEALARALPAKSG